MGGEGCSNGKGEVGTEASINYTSHPYLYGPPDVTMVDIEAAVPVVLEAGQLVQPLNRIPCEQNAMAGLAARSRVSWESEARDESKLL